MTAVAPPLAFQPNSRTGWGNVSGGQNGLNSMNAEEVSRMFMPGPRKSAQRANSASSVSTLSSVNSTNSTSSAQTNGSNIGQADWGTRKKPTRGLWPPGKSEPVAELSIARPQSVSSASSGPSAASAISALHTPTLPSQPSQQTAQSQAKQNGVSRTQTQPENPAILHLTPMNGTFDTKTITVPFQPDILRIGRQTNQKTLPTPTNGYFDSKVLSRQHAEVWAERNGKVFIKDVKSSNGTFVNGQRLSSENRESEPHELRAEDLLELGIDIVSEDQKTVVHHKVAARVGYAGLHNLSNSVLDLNFGDLDPSTSGAMMAPPLNQQSIAQLRRNGGQGPMNGNGRAGSAQGSIAGSYPSVMTRPQYNAAWLTPVTMEQIMKKLNAELKQAQQQGQALTQARQYIDTVLSSESKKIDDKSVVEKAQKHSPTKSKSNRKALFSEPPAPPPQQPLPNKPDAARALPDAALQPMLRRSDTAKPHPGASPSARGDSSHQITRLLEELTTARREIDSQSSKVRDLEEMLEKERLARESAEEKAQRLEIESRKEPTATGHRRGSIDSIATLRPDLSDIDEQNSTPLHLVAVDDSKSELQQKIERMKAEMEEMKQLMESYRRRAETAEDERSTLATMVEKIRNDNADRDARATSRSRRRSIADKVLATDHVAENGTAVMAKDDGASFVRRAGIQDGRPITTEQLAQLERDVAKALAANHRTREVLIQSGPYASAIAVVILGVAMMNWLNGWPKVER